MTSLDFLYIALGIGFLFLVVFLCVFLFQTILVLRDVNKVTKNLHDISDRAREIVFEPLEFLAEISSGWSFANDIVKKIKKRYEKADKDCDDESCSCDEVKKHGFKINKIKRK
jgi:hypothetical protein